MATGSTVSAGNLVSTWREVSSVAAVALSTGAGLGADTGTATSGFMTSSGFDLIAISTFCSIVSST